LLTHESVQKVAHLARLELSEAEVEQYRAQLSQLLDYVVRLEELDLEGVSPTAHAAVLQNVMRPDEVRPSLSPEEALANAASTAGQHFLIQRVLDDAA
jgi:aspartyl-tRNA(Asn)/glutamyl-tRNA(Gln) amidotransferase subunit C